MAAKNLIDEIFDELRTIPVLDIHTHLVDGHLGARGLHDIILYHMSISDLYSAGCPNGGRLTEYPGWPSKEEAHARLAEAIPYLRHTRNTAISWGVRLVLEDLFGWKEELTAENWKKLDSQIRERSDDRAWQRQVMKRTGIQRYGTEYARRESGTDKDILQYSLEWAFFTRCQWGEFDTALYELERVWGKSPESPTPIGSGKRPAKERVIRTLDDVHEALRHYVSHIPYDQLLAMATHISTDIDFTLVSDGEMSNALKRRGSARAGHLRFLYQ